MFPQNRQINKKLTLLFCMSISISFTLLPDKVTGEILNGFDLSGALIPVDEILSGGPPKDGIPAINNPKFLTPEIAHSISDSDRILGIYIGGVPKAYPIKILNWHEIVNDVIDENPFVVTYCPLCGTGIAFSSKVKGSVKKFGVSGLLYNSDVLLYDHKTGSLWSQIQGEAISGPLAGEKLSPVALTHTTWGNWKKRHPRSLVLSEDTGFRRDYASNPYLGYAKNTRLYFPVKHTSSAFHPKELVLGVEAGGKFKAYPFLELKKKERKIFIDTFNGTSLTIKYHQNTAEVFDKNGKLLPGVTAYWFAWYAFHPATEIFRAP